jgi:hypothetical protein
LLPTLLPWIDESLVQHTIPTLPSGDNLGLQTDPDVSFGLLRVTDFVSGSIAKWYLQTKHIRKLYLLEINGVQIRTTGDIQLLLAHSQTQEDNEAPNNDPTPLLFHGLHLIFGKFEQRGDDNLDFSSHEHATLRSKWLLFIDNTSETNLAAASSLLDQDPIFAEYVSSIAPDTGMP